MGVGAWMGVGAGMGVEAGVGVDVGVALLDDGGSELIVALVVVFGSER